MQAHSGALPAAARHPLGPLAWPCTLTPLCPHLQSHDMCGLMPELEHTPLCLTCWRKGGGLGTEELVAVGDMGGHVHLLRVEEHEREHKKSDSRWGQPALVWAWLQQCCRLPALQVHEPGARATCQQAWGDGPPCAAALHGSACYVGNVCMQPAAQPCTRASCSLSQEQQVCLALMMMSCKLEPHGASCVPRSKDMSSSTRAMTEGVGWSLACHATPAGMRGWAGMQHCMLLPGHCGCTQPAMLPDTTASLSMLQEHGHHHHSAHDNKGHASPPGCCRALADAAMIWQR